MYYVYENLIWKFQFSLVQVAIFIVVHFPAIKLFKIKSPEEVLRILEELLRILHGFLQILEEEWRNTKLPLFWEAYIYLPTPFHPSPLPTVYTSVLIRFDQYDH